MDAFAARTCVAARTAEERPTKSRLFIVLLKRGKAFFICRKAVKDAEYGTMQP
jgi:hypothetical protein